MTNPIALATLAPEETLLYAGSFVGTVIFVALGISLFTSGWASYGEKYLEGATRSADDLFLTIPRSHLLWLSGLGAFVPAVMGALVLDSLVLGAALGTLGALSPSIALQALRRKREARFKEQLPDALATLTNALRSGFSLPRAFEVVAHDMPKPVSQEFSILVQELRLGACVEDGLESMLARMPSEDLSLVSTSVAIASSLGGNLAEVFEKIASTIRERRAIEGRVEALTAQGKLQAGVVSLLPVGVGLAIHVIEPELMAPLYTTVPGWCVLGVAAVMEVSGYFFIRKTVSIEV